MGRAAILVGRTGEVGQQAAASSTLNGIELGMTTTNRTPSTPTEPFLTAEQLAAYLALPLETVYDWRREGRGPTAYRLGKHLRFRMVDVEAWLATKVA